MQVILLESIRKLGNMGDVVTVKNGYARNWLLPQRKALRATEDAMKEFEAQKASLKAQDDKKKEEAVKAAEKMKDYNVVIIRTAGDMGQLYGSVTPRNVADFLTNEGFSVTRHAVAIPHPIKELGVHEAFVTLHSDITAKVFINVALTDAEAKTQLKNYLAEAGGSRATAKTSEVNEPTEAEPEDNSEKAE